MWAQEIVPEPGKQLDMPSSPFDRQVTSFLRMSAKTTSLTETATLAGHIGQRGDACPRPRQTFYSWLLCVTSGQQATHSSWRQEADLSFLWGGRDYRHPPFFLWYRELSTGALPGTCHTWGVCIKCVLLLSVFLMPRHPGSCSPDLGGTAPSSS